ncbi:MAG: hypothetical protein Hens3KO_14850 [Henriciella sp.]
MMTSEKLRSEIKGSGLTVTKIATLAQVAAPTLYSFMSGATKNLRSSTHASIERVITNLNSKSVREDPTTFHHAPNLAAEARTLGLDPDAIAAKAIEDAIKRKRMQTWNEENRDAIEGWNEHYRKNGLWNDGRRLW